MPLILHYGVPLAALLVCAGEMGIPTGFPMEIVLLLTGAYAIHSVPALVASVLLVAVADLLGTTALYLVVRKGRTRLLVRLLRGHDARYDAAMTRWRRRLGNRDIPGIFVARLVPLVRMWATIGAAALRIHPRTFLLGAAPAALIWSGVPIGLGYAFRTNVHAWEARYSAASHYVLLGLPAVGLIVGLAWWVGHGSSPRANLSRGSSVLGLVATVVTIVFLVDLV